MREPPLYCQSYAPQNDRIRICTNEPRLLALADRLWLRAPPSSSGEDGHRAALDFALSVVPDPDNGAAPEGSETWTIEPERITLVYRGSLILRIEFHPPRVAGHVSESLLIRRPGVVARQGEPARGTGTIAAC